MRHIAWHGERPHRDLEAVAQALRRDSNERQVRHVAVKLLQKLTAMYAPRVASELREDEAAANYWEERRRQCVYRAALMAYCVDDLRTMRVHDEPAITGADRMTIDAALMFCETARDDAIDLALEAHMHQYLQR